MLLKPLVYSGICSLARLDLKFMVECVVWLGQALVFIL